MLPSKHSARIISEDAIRVPDGGALFEVRICVMLGFPAASAQSVATKQPPRSGPLVRGKRDRVRLWARNGRYGRLRPWFHATTTRCTKQSTIPSYLLQ